MKSEPRNILVLHFGQIGDVIFSLPALGQIRERFPEARITGLFGRTARAIAEMAGTFDEVFSVDRVELRDSNKLWSVGQIFKLIRDVRRRKFDLVIDLHSLYETNLLGFLSGAEQRLFASRENRSLDVLSNFRPRPPAVDHSVNMTASYLRSLRPLGIDETVRSFRLSPPDEVRRKVDNIIRRDNPDGRDLVGINLGAGNPSRRWSLSNFAELAGRLAAREDVRVVVFYGPEERPRADDIEKAFSGRAMVYDKFDLQELAAAFTHLKALVGNDTGPMHLAAVSGVPVVYITDPFSFLPPVANVHVAKSGTPDQVGIEDVLAAVLELL